MDEAASRTVTVASRPVRRPVISRCRLPKTVLLGIIGSFVVGFCGLLAFHREVIFRPLGSTGQ
jgi:hypothetical protein